MKNMIHVSHTTAAELESFGKGGWLVKRETPVEAKGKGTLETYFVRTTVASHGSSHGSEQDLSTVRLSINQREEEVSHPKAGF